MRYMLFAGENYYPSGGMNDFRGNFHTMVSLVKKIGRADWFNVYDTVLRKAVDCPRLSGMNGDQIFTWAEQHDHPPVIED